MLLTSSRDGFPVSIEVFRRASSTVARVHVRRWILIGCSAVLLAAALLRGFMRGWSVEIAVPMVLLASNVYLAFREARAMDKQSSDGG